MISKDGQEALPHAHAKMSDADTVKELQPRRTNSKTRKQSLNKDLRKDDVFSVGLCTGHVFNLDILRKLTKFE